MRQNHLEILKSGTFTRPKNMFWFKINSYFVKLCNKTSGTTRFRIEVKVSTQI